MDELLATVEPEIRALEVYLELNGVHLWEFAKRWVYMAEDVPLAVNLYAEVKKKFKELHRGCSIKLHFGPNRGIKSPTNTYWIMRGSSKHHLKRRKAGNLLELCIPIDFNTR